MNTVENSDTPKLLFGEIKFTPEDRKRFNEKIDKSDAGGCWIWTSATVHDGYGIFEMRVKTVRAHRVAYELEYGPIPKGMCVCHACDNPACVNPKHLFVGTTGDNTRDARDKGRMAKGSKNGNSKLTEDQVIEIKRLLGLSISQDKIAGLFGVNQTVISCIKLGHTWKHVHAHTQ